jgi:hypothetical protein
VTTDIVKTIQAALTVEAKEEGKPSFVEPQVVAGLGESELMGDQNPFLGKNSPSLQLI